MKRILGRRLAAQALCVPMISALVGSIMTVTATAQTSGEPTDGAASAAAGNPTTMGDLSHLVYTARAGLVAHPISPDDGGVVNAVATAFEVATVAGAGVELAINGIVVPAKKLGRRAELEDGTVRYTYYGVVLEPGANVVVLTPLGADGLRGPSVKEHVWGPGPPASISLTGCSRPHADGRTPCVVRIAVLDAWGHPAAPGSTLKMAVTDGDAVILPSGIAGGEVVADAASPGQPADPSMPSGQRSMAVVLGGGSSATIQVVPGTIPGRIRISAGIGAISGATQFDAMAFGRPPFVTGLATVGVGAVPGDVGADPTIADGTNSRRGRVALYGTGSLSGNAVGSLAYDTAGALAATTSSGTFNDDPNDRPYSTYGDASTRRNDALTQDRLYARIDDGYDSAMWGEFEASTGPQGTAGAVAMQVDGAKFVLGSAAESLSAFTAANQIGYGRELLLPSGLATLTSLAHDNLIVGSEVVTLVSLDRRSGVILHQTTLQDVVDYTIDYASGLIRFINVPLPYDIGFNPQQVLVTYEYSAIGGSAKTTGVRFDGPVSRFDRFRFGLGYLNDVTGTGDFTLLTENASGLLPGGIWTFSHAGSNGFVPGVNSDAANGASGSALRFGGTTATGPYKLNFGYDATAATYDNPFGDLQTPGLTDYHASLLRAFPGQHGDLSLAFDQERSAAFGTVGASTQANLAALLHVKFNPRLLVRAGVTFHESFTPTAAGSAPSPEASSPPATTTTTTDQGASVTQAVLGVDWKALRNLTLGVERDQTIGGSDATQPAQTTAQLSYDLGGRGRIFAQELLSDTPARMFDSMASVAAATHAFAFGYDQRLDANTSLESTYNVAGTGNGTDVSAALGVKQHLVISKLLRGDAFVQRGFGGGSASAQFLVFGMSLAYGDPGGRIRATGSLQDRSGTGAGATWSLGVAGRLFNDVSLLAADQGSRTAGSATADERLAVAWRPSTSDRGALLAGYERSSGNANVAGAQSGVASLDGVFRPTRRLELTGRYARKIDGDSNYVVGTSLIGFGVRQQLGPRFDAGIETRAILAQSAVGGLHSTAVEIGSMVGTTMRAALGYNFGVTADATLAQAPTRKGFYATLTTTIDRIFGWGAH